MTKAIIKKLTYDIIGAAIEVHRIMGPGLLEKVYEECLVHELTLRGISVVRQKTIPLEYKGVLLSSGFICDLLVEGSVVVEIKAVKKFIPIFEAQVLTYAQLMIIPKCILLNFTCGNIFREGQKTFVNKHYQLLPEE